MTAVRVCVVSDSHLSPDAPEAGENWDAVVRHVADSQPDLVLHLGDLALDGTGDDLTAGRLQLDRLAVPWRAVPGNHDIGDNPWDGSPDGITVDADRREHWLDTIGPDRWSVTLGEWRLVAVDAQLFGSGLEAETQQWAWLEEQFASAHEGPVALVTHKPVTAPSDERAASPVYRFVPEEARRRLSDLTDGWRAVDVVLSGHVHQYRVLDADGVRHVWAPTTWAVLPDDMQPIVGTKRCGVVTLELGAEPVVEPVLVEPDGLRQLTLIEDIPSPYGH